jgi:hypothetical protein
MTGGSAAIVAVGACGAGGGGITFAVCFLAHAVMPTPSARDNSIVATCLRILTLPFGIRF